MTLYQLSIPFRTFLNLCLFLYYMRHYVTKAVRLAMLDRFYKFNWIGWRARLPCVMCQLGGMNKLVHSEVHGRVKIIKANKEELQSQNVVSNSKFKQTQKLMKILLTALSNFKTIMKFQSKYFNTDKTRQYEEV